MLSDLFSSGGSGRRPSPQRQRLELFLTQRSGYYVAEAWGILGLKLGCLGLTGLLVWAAGEAWSDGVLPFVLAMVLFVVPGVVLFGWVAMFTYSGLVIERLNPLALFRRVRRSAHRPELAVAPSAATPSVHGPRVVVIAALVLLSIPAAYVLTDLLLWTVRVEILDPPLSRYVPRGLVGHDQVDEVTRRHQAAGLIVFLLSLVCLLAMLVLAGPPLVRSLLRRRAAFRRARAVARQELRGRTSHHPLREVPDGALCSSPRSHLGLYLRTLAYLLLGLPATLLGLYCLLAYLAELWEWLQAPFSRDPVSWRAPADASAFGEFLVDSEWPWFMTVAVTLSAAFLGAAIALATLSLPRLTRRGAEAIDLAVTPEGALVRGGLEIGWDEIAEVIVVRDLRARSATSPGVASGLGGPRRSVNLTYVPAHSRTRIALVLHDLGAVAERAVGVEPPRHHSLRTDRTDAYGYALCDLWTYDHDDVAGALEQVQDGAARHGVPVTDLERVVFPTKPAARGIGPLGVLLTWR